MKSLEWPLHHQSMTPSPGDPQLRDLLRRSPCGVRARHATGRPPRFQGTAWGTGRAVRDTRNIPQVRSQALLGCGNLTPCDPARDHNTRVTLAWPQGSQQEKDESLCHWRQCFPNLFDIMSPSPLYRSLYYLESLGSPKIPLGKCRPSAMTIRNKIKWQICLEKSVAR